MSVVAGVFLVSGATFMATVRAVINGRGVLSVMMRVIHWNGASDRGCAEAIQSVGDDEYPTKSR